MVTVIFQDILDFFLLSQFSLISLVPPQIFFPLTRMGELCFERFLCITRKAENKTLNITNQNR